MVFLMHMSIGNPFNLTDSTIACSFIVLLAVVAFIVIIMAFEEEGILDIT
jgi:hypothetical protein